tara:strand:- start:779 stop:973 length:195 start_codon:yes stop_codon:yes gene_type:complete
MQELRDYLRANSKRHLILGNRIGIHSIKGARPNKALLAEVRIVDKDGKTIETEVVRRSFSYPYD